MVIVCAWCTARLGVKYPCDDSSTTHGICHGCFVKQIKVLVKYEDPMEVA